MSQETENMETEKMNTEEATKDSDKDTGKDTEQAGIPVIAEATIGDKLEELLDEKTEKWKSKKAAGKDIGSHVSNFVHAYGRYIGMGAVIAALLIVCVISLVQRMSERDVTTGVMMTVSDVVKGKEAFSGDMFVATGITYEDMVNVNYETEQLAQLERAEKQIDEILSAKRQDKRDQAALEALTAVHSAAEDIGLYDPNAVVVIAANTNTSYTAPAATGTTTYVPADPNGNYQYLGEYLLTAYCPCPICCGKWSNMVNPVTASGNPAIAGWSIAAPKEFPFGTKIMIDGQIYSVEDRGGAITGNHFDIYCNTHEEALHFNMRTTSAYLVVE